MLLAKHSQLQPVNCLISHQSISPNKVRCRSGASGGGCEHSGGARANGRAAMSEEQAEAGYSLSPSYPAPPRLLSVWVCVCARVPPDNLLFETVERIRIEGDTQEKGGRTGWGWHYQAAASKHQPTMFFYRLTTARHTLLAHHVVCVYKRDSFSPSRTIKWEHFQNEKHMEPFNWPISLATVWGFFSIQKTNERDKKKKSYLVRHAYCSTECCTNCHCPSARSRTALLFPGLIAPLQRIHVQYTALYF